MFVHMFFVDGLLIDTGHYNMRKEILNTLQQLNVQQLFLTHHHEDHTANAGLLSQHFNCTVYASKKCAELMKHPPKISFVQQLIWGKAQAFISVITKDDYIETPNHRFDIIAAPGHAIDMVCLLEKNKGWLFSADLWVANRIKLLMSAESMAQQIESIKHILHYDFEVLFCSHNPQFSNGKTCLQQKLQFLQDFYGQAAYLYQQGNSAKAIFKKMNLKENKWVKFLSGGELCRLNMVLSVIRDEEQKRSKKRSLKN